MRMRAFSPVCRWILGALCSLAADLAGAQAVEPLPALRVEDGVLVDANGREVALWGVNYQASLWWEYGETFSRVGIPLEAGPLKRAVDQDLAHFKRMGVSVVRVHISPSDFTDAEGKLVDTVFLDVFDYLVARCREEGLYVFLSLFNRIGQYVRHCEKPFRKRLVPPILPDGTYPKWFTYFRPDYAALQWLRQKFSARQPVTHP
jgi:hypothetical protein